MTGKIPAEDINSSISNIAASVTGIERGVQQSAEKIVDSVKDFIYRTLNSDVDSVYALLGLFKNKEVIACTKAINDIVKALELAPSSRNEKVTLSEDRVDNIGDIMDSFTTSSAGQRPALLNALEGAVASLSRSAVSSTGASLAGMDRDVAKATVQTLCANLSLSIKEILKNAAFFHDALITYAQADLESAGVSIQADNSLTIVEAHADDVEQNPQQALVDIAVATSLLKQASKGKRDITLPKYEGGVVTLPGSAAEVFGGTVPYILQIPEGAGFKLNGSTEQPENPDYAISSLASERPLHVVSLPENILTRKDAGSLGSSVGKTGVQSVGADAQSSFYDDAKNLIAPALKDIVVPGTVKIAGSYLATEGDPSTITSWELTDEPATADYNPYVNGTFSVTPGLGGIDGYIDYITGNYAIDLQSHFPELVGPIHITYEYYFLGDLMYRYGGFGSGEDNSQEVSFAEFSAVVHNNPITGAVNVIADDNYPNPRRVVTDVAQTGLSTTTNWQASLSHLLKNETTYNDEEAGAYLAITPGADKGLSFTVSLGLGGSAYRLTYPKRDAPVVNAQPFAPKFAEAPTLNALLGLTNSGQGDRYGKDSPYEALIRSGIGAIEFVVNKHVANSDAVPFQAVDGVDSPFGLMSLSIPEHEVILAGDDLYDKITQSRSKVVAVEEDDDEWYVTATPSFARPLADVGSLIANMSTADLVITRNKVKVESVSEEAASKVEVLPASGLGFSGGSATGVSKAIALGERLDLNNVATAPGYNIKPGDPVLEIPESGVPRLIGAVETVLGNRITVVIQPDTTFDYPFIKLQVVALGWQSHKAVRSSLSKAVSELGKLDPAEITKLANIYTESGAAQGEFFRLLGGFLTGTANLRNSYLNYKAHVVNTTSLLLDYLKQEKLTLPYEWLMTAQFNNLAGLTPAQVSSKSDIEGMMDIAVSMLGGGATTVEVTRGNDTLLDFVERDTDPLTEFETVGEYGED